MRSSDHSLLPPPKALPIASVMAATAHLDRDSETAQVLGVQRKSNGMSAWSDEPERLLPEARIGIADIADIKPSCQLDAQILAIQPVSRANSGIGPLVWTRSLRLAGEGVYLRVHDRGVHATLTIICFASVAKATTHQVASRTTNGMKPIPHDA